MFDLGRAEALSQGFKRTVAGMRASGPIAILLDTGIVEIWDGTQWLPMAEV